MHIAVTGLRGIPGVMGGVESHCEELLPRVAALAPDLEIEVLARRPYVGPERTKFQGVNVTPLPAPKRQSSEALVSTLLGTLHARRHRARLIHIHAVGPALLAPLARLLGLRVAMTHHGNDYDRAKWGRFAKFMLRLGEGWGIAAAHKVIAVSPSLRDRLAGRYPQHAARIVYIPNGAPALTSEGETQETCLARLGLDPQSFILAVGRLVPEKGFDYLIDAFRKSETQRKLVIAGGSDHASTFSRALMRQADAQVIFLGQQPRSVLRHLYEGSDMFVLPSFHEGLPISALEAAFCGTPMLLSDIQPNLDIGLPAHNYFPAGDVEALSERLSRPASEFAVDGATIRRRFDWDEIARNTLEIYRELL